MADRRARRERFTAQRSFSSKVFLLSVAIQGWAVVAVVGAIRAAGRFSRSSEFTLREVLVAVTPYLFALIVLLVLFLISCREPGSLSRQPQFVKLGMIVAAVAALTAWVLVAYAAAISELWTGR